MEGNMGFLLFLLLGPSNQMEVILSDFVLGITEPKGKTKSF